MNTPSTRRSFLRNAVVGVAAAPLLVKAAMDQKIEPKKLYPYRGEEGDVINLYSLDGPPGQWGEAIKVPSNRMPCCGICLPSGARYMAHTYMGDWDGTFKLESGCTNPAWVLADLYERTGTELDWVVARKMSVSLYEPWVMSGISQLLKPQLDWQMLYDWGRFCDELVGPASQLVREREGNLIEILPQPVVWRELPWSVRFTVDVPCRIQEERDQLRNDLRMYCLSWQSQDSRYRTSWPGIPYPQA